MDQKFRFTHLLTVTGFPVFMKLVKDNFKDIEKEYYPQLLVSGGVSLLFAPIRLLERTLFDSKETRKPIKDPVFITGHWRCGTTLLQYMMSRDKTFGIVDPLMSYTLNFYHLLGWAFKPLIPPLLAEGRAMDNMKYAMDLPLEEYIVFATTEAKSVYPLNFFPKKYLEFNRNAFVGQMNEAEKKHWLKKYDKLLRKVSSINGGKRLLLKSPDATARVEFLKKVYPGAKFVNIYRDPYTVVRSTIHLYSKIFDLWSLEKVPDEETMEDWVIEIFKEMYENFFEEIKSLPEDSFYEVKFEEFEKDPLPIMEDIYKKLNLADYEPARAAIEEYWKEQDGYQKNQYDYPERLIKKVNERLGFYFEHYGYEIRETSI